MSGNIVTLRRKKKIDGHKLYGVIVRESTELVLLHQMVDFAFDGYVVVRRKDIVRRVSSPSDEYVAKLMRLEGLWENHADDVKTLPVDSWENLLRQFIGKVVILECERRDEFYIGPVVSVDEKGVEIHFFDGCGEFMDVEYVPFKRLTIMKFGDRYSTIHAKYLKELIT